MFLNKKLREAVMQVRREWLVLKPVINISPIHPASHTPSSASSLAQHRLIFIALKWWRYLKWSQGSQSSHLSTHTAKLFSSLANCRWTQQQSRSYYSFQGFSCVCGSGPSVYFERDLSTTINFVESVLLPVLPPERRGFIVRAVI